MPRIPVSAKTLINLGDGFAEKAIDRSLGEINADLIDRGDDGKVRKLVLTYTFAPGPNNTVKIGMNSKATLPALQPQETQARYDHAAGGYVFNPDASGNPDQQTFEDVTEGGEVVPRRS